MAEVTGKEQIAEAISEDLTEEYARRLSVAKCSCGTKDFCQYLNIPKDHGIYYQGEDYPLLNANDHHGSEHIMHFGRCQSEMNPKNAVSNVLSKAHPLFGAIDMIKDAVGSDGCKCAPRTLRSWDVPNKENRLDGAPAVTRTSQAICVYGGLIEITDDPDAQKSSEDEESNEETTDVLDTLPEEMGDKIRELNSDADAAALAAAEWYEENADTFVQDLCCTPMMSAQNYSNNSTQVISADCISNEGYVTNIEGLSNFNIGGSNMAAIGGSCAAAYNMLRALGTPQQMPEVIRNVEKQQEIPGVITQGPAAVSIMGMSSMFQKLGFDTKISFPKQVTEESLQLEEGEVAVLATSAKTIKSLGNPFGKRIEKQKIHREESFCTFAKGKERLICMEKPDDAASELLKQHSENTMILMKVKK